MRDLVLSIDTIADACPEDLSQAEALILGVSTWEDGQLQSDWERFFPAMDQVDLTGKTVALFGLGNAAGFSGEFASALGLLHDKVVERGARVVGSWPADDYRFLRSAALRDGRFVGLVIDEDTEAKKTVARVERWARLIRPEFL
jgi:flavodoxin I